MQVECKRATIRNGGDRSRDKSCEVRIGGIRFMAFVNFATHEITAKIVFYGPGLGGKTTSLQYIHNNLSPDNRGKMISLATEEDRTIYFDFLPLHLGKIQDFAIRVQLYTVPGQVRYNATRKLVLRGADGLVFVADSQRHKKMSNVESLSNLEENLREHGKELRDLPHVLQFNKIDLPNIMTGAELTPLLNKYNVPFFETCATIGVGIMETLKSVTKLVFNDLGKKALLQKKNKPSTALASSGSTERPVLQEPAAMQHAASGGAPVPTYSGASMENNYGSISNPAYSSGQYESPKVETEYSADPESHGEIESLDFEDQLSSVEPVSELGEGEELTGVEYLAEQEGESLRFSYSALVNDDEHVARLFSTIEAQLASGNSQGAVATARDLYSYLFSTLVPKDYAVEGQESLLMLALQAKFRRFLRFKTVLQSPKVEVPDALFVHHFLIDFYLSLKEL